VTEVPAGELLVLDGGPLTTVQDLGRPGHAHEGVPPSGAADRCAHGLANRLVGNPTTEATLEITFGGLRLRLTGGGTRHVALTGAPGPLVVGGRAAPIYRAVAVRPGELVAVGPPVAGLRSYLAVAGGIATAPELGSRSSDLLSGLGPPPLHAGAILAVGPAAVTPAADVVPVPDLGGDAELRFTRGPRDDWLSPDAWELVVSTPWRVAGASNRVGLRLEGPPLRDTAGGELAPEGIVTGAVQVPPGGRPIIFLNDHPVTGGYPVVAVIDDDSLPAAAQARPGTVVRLLPARSGYRWVG
jgi:biotin-dependent carboxylase-like uncharacterized protein